jgi:hypothetical protein
MARRRRVARATTETTADSASTTAGSEQDPLIIPIPGSPSTPEEDTTMAFADGSANQGLAAELIGQSMGQLSGSSVVAQNNFITVNKALDYDFIEGKRMIGLEEAVGVREVSSKRVPAGPSVPA